jgi:peptidoglycan-N-acetylglucosamine deacetylase
VGLPRILDLLERRDIRATFCVPGHTAYAYPTLVKRIHEQGHELVHHGWVHENPADFDRDGEKNNLERSLEALDRAAGVRPKGYRSPAWDFSRNTIDLLLEYGFVYDSSCMGNDSYPYYLRNDDEWSTTGPYVFGETCELVEVPVTWGLDDFPAFEYVPGWNAGLAPPSTVEEIWTQDFDYALTNCPGGRLRPNDAPAGDRTRAPHAHARAPDRLLRGTRGRSLRDTRRVRAVMEGQ